MTSYLVASSNRRILGSYNREQMHVNKQTYEKAVTMVTAINLTSQSRVTWEIKNLWSVNYYDTDPKSIIFCYEKFDGKKIKKNWQLQMTIIEKHTHTHSSNIFICRWQYYSIFVPVNFGISMPDAFKRCPSKFPSIFHKVTDDFFYMQMYLGTTTMHSVHTLCLWYIRYSTWYFVL